MNTNMQMLKRSVRVSVYVLLTAAWLLTACNANQRSEPIMDDVQIQAPEVLATPAAESPAAGICAEFSESQVLVTINPDIPDPRCTKIQPSQKLVVENRRQENLRVQIGPFDVLISPGGRHLFDLPFGDYLAPGVHQMIVSPCCGAELWLEIP